jgi:hypothetical protein
VKAYFQTVRKIVQDAVPKAIMLVLVNYVRVRSRIAILHVDISLIEGKLGEGPYQRVAHDEGIGG